MQWTTTMPAPPLRVSQRMRFMWRTRGQSAVGGAIEKWYADLFQKLHFSDHVITIDPDSPHVLGTDGKQMWATGGWSTTIKGEKGEKFGPTPIKGYWSVIREGDDWKIRMLMSNVAPAPAAPAETK
jgi:hypothetical protein